MSGLAQVVADEPQPGTPRRSASRRPARAESIRAQAPVREVRRHKRTDSAAGDPFYIPKSMIPKGFDVNWKTVTVYGKPVDESVMVEYQEQGWKPATSDQFPRLVVDGAPGKAIFRKGMQLMIRPDYLTKEAQAEDLQIAREQVRDKLRSLTQTGEGEMQRRVQGIKRSYERPPADDDEM
jgi:hypothetical protein